MKSLKEQVEDIELYEFGATKYDVIKKFLILIDNLAKEIEQMRNESWDKCSRDNGTTRDFGKAVGYANVLRLLVGDKKVNHV
jgi:hypothetical protein